MTGKKQEFTITRDVLRYNRNNEHFYTRPKTVCAICKIGIGETKYKDGMHQHMEEKEYEYKNFKLCEDCYERTKEDKNYLKKRFAM